MIVGLLTLSAVLLAFSRAACRSGSRLTAARAARAATLALFLGWLVVELALALAAMPAAASILGANRLATFCEHAFGRILPGGFAMSWAAGGLAALLAFEATRGLLAAPNAARRARVEPWLGDHHDQGGYELVFLPTDALLAVSVPGRPPQVVVSQGLLAQLGPQEREIVIQHELAHLQLGHRRTLVLLTIVERSLRWVPLVRATAQRIRDLLEEAADDHAVAGSQLRRTNLARALISAIPNGPWSLSHSPPRSIVARLEHLACRPRPRVSKAAVVGIYLPILTAVFVVASLLGGWFIETRHAAALTMNC